MTATFNLSALEFRQAFDWVMEEVDMDPLYRETFFRAAEAARSRGGAGIRLLAAAWPSHARWPNGHDYLQQEIQTALADEDEWSPGDPPVEVPQRDLLSLLHARFVHAAQRLYRNAQVKELFSHADLRDKFTHIEINRFVDEADIPCGRGKGALVTVKEGLGLMAQLTCQHPACCCTFDPYKQKGVD